MGKVVESIALFFFKKELRKPRYKTMLEKIGKGLGWLEGKRSEILAGVGVIVVILEIAGVVTPDQRDAMLQVLGSGFALTFAAKVSRVASVLKDVKALASK